MNKHLSQQLNINSLAKGFTFFLSMKKPFFIALVLFSSITAFAQIPKFGKPKNLFNTTPTTTTDGPFSYDKPREYEVAEIKVIGHKFYSPDAVISVAGIRVGDKINIPGLAISTAIKKIYDLGIFSEIDIEASKIEEDKIYLNIIVKERPRLAEFIFKGIKKGQVTDLKEKVKFIKGQIVNDSRIKNLQLTVKKYFLEKGYFNTIVTISPITDTVRANSVVLKINIDRGRKVKIHKIILKGNKVYTTKKVFKKLKETKQKQFGRIFKPSKFVLTKYEEDKLKLIKYYNSQGYRDARVVSDTFYRYNNKMINLELNLEEGRRYFYRNITWQGNYLYTSAQLSQVLGIKKGDIYNIEDLEKRLRFKTSQDDITSLYMDRGYLSFDVNPTEVAVEGDSIDIEVRMSEGKQFDINRIIVSGNTRTSDHVILREILTIPGEKFSRSDIIQTQQRLSSLGYFNPEKIDIQPIPDIQNGKVDIHYTVEERPSDQIELSGGWGGYFGFVGTLGLVFNNFSARKIFDIKAWKPVPHGDGQKLSVRFQANGKQFQTYSLGFTEPWLGGKKPNSLSISLSRTIQHLQSSSIFGNRFNPYGGFGGNQGYNQYGSGSAGSLSITGVSIGLGRRLQKPDPYFNLSNSISFQLYNLKNYNVGFPFTTGKAHNLSFITTLSRYSLDQQIFPRGGSSITLSVALTPPWSSFKGTVSEKDNLAHPENQYKLVEYHKWMFDGSWFSAVFGKFVLNTRVHMGFIGRYNNNTSFSPFERFTLGGTGLVGQNFALARDIIPLRGYNNNVLNPITYINGTTSGPAVQGGIVYNKYVMELRYPVSLNPSATIFVLAFMEGGNTWANFQQYNPFKIYRTAGIGARIFMPAFGMIGIDYGKAFDMIPGQADGGRQTFQFTIGQQLR